MKIQVNKKVKEIIENLSNVDTEALVESVHIDSDEDNPCRCVILNDKGHNLMRELFGMDLEIGGLAGNSGHVSIQYPVTPDSQTYVENDNLIDIEIDGVDYDEERELMSEIVEFFDNLAISGDLGDSALYEFCAERKFGGRVRHCDALVEHGFGDCSLCILENIDVADKYYVTFENHRPNEYTKEYFESNYAQFNSLKDAQDYIRGFKDNDETWQDFNISYRINKELNSY